MAVYGLNNQIDFSGSLTALPAKTFQKITEKLDSNPRDSDWRALMRIVEDNYHVSRGQMELWSPAINGLQSAAARALTELSGQGMTVIELKGYLEQLHIDTYPMGLCQYESITVIEQPHHKVDVYEGGQLVIEVKATGHPYPRYQWFFCKDGGENFDRLEGRTEGILRIDNATKENSGTYSCQIHNSDDVNKTVITDFSVVTVSSAPSLPEPSSPVKQMDNASAREILLNLGPAEQDTWGKLQDSYRERSTRSHCLITKHPSDVIAGLHDEIMLSVETCGDPPIRYEWYRNGQPLPFYAPRLRIADASPEDFGDYHCVVKNGIVSETSNIAHVTEQFPTYAQLTQKSVDIVLVSQPKCATVKFGGSVIFSCEAKCCLPLRYQWFKDGTLIPGETGSECKIINIQDRRCEGMYQCEVSVDRSDCPRRLTSVAFLNVQVPTNIENIEYNPSDKVALLIGNYDYRNEQPLKAPSVDVHVLSEIFRSLQFRVISLLNLTKSEIENAVEEFSHLVEQNVYAVFYFCGHGFEENGISYLVPNDAPAGYRAEECVRADLVLEKIQKKEPPLIFMIMDICRKRNKVSGSGIPIHFPKTQRGNTVYCYATSLEMNAFEDRRRGLLVHHLEPILRRPIGIEALVSELKEEFSRDPKHSCRQIPELRSNLLEPRRSLTDKISTKGQTEAYRRRQMIWDQAHVKPQKQDLCFREIGVKVELDFQSDFSNVLHIFATIKNRGITSQCRADIENTPLTVSQKVREVPSGDGNIITTTSIHDIQKLQTKMLAELVVTFTLPDSNKVYRRSSVMDFGMPLVSVLKLWRPTTTYTYMYRQPTEQTEDTDSL